MLMDRVVYQLPIGPVIALATEKGWLLSTMEEWATGRPPSHLVAAGGRILCAGRPTGWTISDLEESLTPAALRLLGRPFTIAVSHVETEPGASASGA